MRILGLDISTSIVGYTVLEDDFTIVKIGHIDFKKCENFWEKVDFGIQEIKQIVLQYAPEYAYIEEPVQSFSPGFSSAATIITLSKFNAILSYNVREILHKDPNHITAAESRKLCGLKMQQRKKCGKTHKEQVFDQISAKSGYLGHMTFPLTKTGKLKPFVYDEIDSYVIARSGIIKHKTVK